MVTGPGDEKSAADRQRLRLRASHADRERVIEVIKTAFVQGRLDKDELDTRAAQAFTSRTYADLAAITADLPAGPAAAPPPRGPGRAQPRPRGNTDVKTAVSLIIAAILIPVALWTAAFLTGGGGLVGQAFMVTVLDFMALLVAVAQILDSRHRKRSGGVGR